MWSVAGRAGITGDRYFLVKPTVKGFNPPPLIKPILKDIYFTNP